VVTFRDEGLNSRFVQNDTSGICFVGLRSNMPALIAGQVVEIEGVTSPGACAPIILPGSIKVVGEGNLPDDSGAFDALRSGSDVVVSGICLIERGSGWRGGGDWRARSFRLLLRSPADVVVLRAPPIWRQFGIRPTLSVLLAVVVLLLLWIVLLYRRMAARRAPRV
jgi:hypothetical protein